MDFLLTWYECEEVNYRFLGERELKKVKFEDDKSYTLTEIKTGKVISNAQKFIRHSLF